MKSPLSLLQQLQEVQSSTIEYRLYQLGSAKLGIPTHRVAEFDAIIEGAATERSIKEAAYSLGGVLLD